MVDVVVFGTGSTGERAWRAASALPDINIVCFADNDDRKHSARLHGLAIVGPDRLTSERWDFIVLASMYAADIERQLHDLGVPPATVVAADPNQFGDVFAALPARKRAARSIRLEDGTTILAGDLPRVMVVTDGMLTQGEDASRAAEALLGAFPTDRLFNVCRTPSARPWAPQAVALSGTGDEAAAAAVVARELGARAFAPDVVLAVIRSLHDLRRLEIATATLPAGIPVVEYFAECHADDARALAARAMGATPKASAIWTATAGMARALESAGARDVLVVAPWNPESGLAAPRPPRAADAGFRAVMAGAIHEPALLAAVGRVWRSCRQAVPGLRPLDWYVHPADLQACVDAGGDLGDDIVWRGSPNEQALHARLAASDLALLPVNLDDVAANDWARLSLPARLGDLCAAGLPIFAIASADTEAAQRLADWRCGVAASGADEAIARRLLALMGAPAERGRMAANARASVAVPPGVLAHDARVAGELARLVRACQPIGGARGPRKEGLVRLAGSEGAASARLEDVLTDRIHYACGRNVLAGWLNVDGYDESFPSGEVPAEIAGRIFRLDLTGRHPFPSAYFRLGYSEDFVEHIDQAEFASFLCECFRTFAPGGILRLSSPGLEGVLRRHLRGSDWEAANVLREEAYERWWHKHFLCFAEVDAIARHIGWRDVRLSSYGESPVPDLVQETRPTQADLNLVVELVK